MRRGRAMERAYHGKNDISRPDPRIGDPRIGDPRIGAAISKLVSNVIENLLHNPWRSYLLAYEDGAYIIGGGRSQGIRINDRFNVYRRGKTVRNPQTGMMVELPGQIVGVLSVVSLMGNDPLNEVSLCNVASGMIPRTDLDQYYIQER